MNGHEPDLPAEREIIPKQDVSTTVRACNWWLLVLYLPCVVIAWLGELWTRFSTATFGFYYISIGMPVWLIVWFVLTIINEIDPLPKTFLIACMAVGVSAVVGYLNINP